MNEPLHDLEAVTRIEELEEKIAPGGLTISVGPITVSPNTIVRETL
jgi:hypothetical protein